MSAQLELGVCPTFAAEFRAAVSALHFDDVVVRVRRVSCLGTPAHGESSPAPGATQLDLRCSRPRDEPRTGRTMGVEQCFHLLAGASLVTELQREGAYVVTPGWVLHWQARLTALGFDPAAPRGRTTPHASELFGESMREVVLLDTGLDPGARDACAAFAQHVGLPHRVVPLGLDHLEERLRSIVGAWRLEGERERARQQTLASQRRAAELSMALDLLRELSGAASEDEVAGRIIDLFSALFAPAELVFRSMNDGAPGRCVPDGVTEETKAKLAAFRGTAPEVSDGGFLVPLVTRGELVAVVWVGGLAFPERLESYLNLAWSVAELCALAVKSARSVVRQRQVELELRQAQKLESVGRLAAGIAHEINTPTQFVGDNVTFASEALANVLRLLDCGRQLARKVHEGTATRDDAADFLRQEEQLELPFVVENLPPAFAQALEGLDRIATIVRSMREFAHPTSIDQEPADLNHALQTTLAIARHEYKYVADVVLELGALPPVSCYLAELNQVFLNLLINAAHAIRDVVGDSGHRGRITVRSWRDGPDVIVAIADTGTGIPVEAREHVFEQFFTTKEVGRGTGQGLAIAWQVVVERHGGALTFETALGAGTTFFVRLPVSGAVRQRGGGEAVPS